MSLAEYLPRLGQVSVKMAFPEPLEAITKVGIHQNHLVVQASREYATKLPGISFKDAKITLLTNKDGVLAISIAIGMIEPPSTFMTLANSNNQMWSVRDLLKTPKDLKNVNRFTLCCTQCGHTIVDSSTVKFADMPLEYWHELMDFWHCHKPHEDHHNENSKTYGKLVPREGHVYVGASYFLLHGLNVCDHCTFILGEKDGDSAKLFKWNLELCYGNIKEQYPEYAFAYYAILDKINSSGTRKFTISNGCAQFHVWVAGVGLDVGVRGEFYYDALKLLYCDVGEADDVLNVPEVVYASLRKRLLDVNSQILKGSQSVIVNENGMNVAYSISYLTSS